jgi:uncharacterized protein (DUF1800 family)
MRDKILSVALVFILSASSTLPASGRTPKAGHDSQAALFHAKLTKDQQVLHALDRLTFGPRPGDMAQVKKMGLQKWVELQLHPERISEDPVLLQKLAPLESLNMSNAELASNYPPPQMLIAVATGRAPLPADPEKRAMLERLATRYQNRLSKKGVEDSKLTAEEKVPLKEILSTDELRVMKNGTPEERAGMLRDMPSDKLEKVVFDMPDGARRALFAYSPTDVRRKMLFYAAPQQVLAHDLYEGKIYRAVYSNRQLEEVMTDFWFNHFNVYLDKGADHYLVTTYEREAIRPHVLGNFKDLILATAQSPAMLFYLDNWQSVGPNANAGRGKNRARGLNENYGRELLELHTMGVDGGYTQKDVTEVARCFTGWTIKEPYRGAGFEFNPKTHDTGEKTVLGVKIPAGGGMDDGLKVIDIIMNHPSTARFISRSLAQRFVADNPPQSLVDAMAKTFEKTQGDIREVMKTMLHSREFWSQGAYRAKMKSPLEMVASAVRATGADVNFAFGLANKVADLGQPLYRKQEPTGYSNSGQEWVNSAGLLARMNFALALTQNKLPGIKVDPRRFEGNSTELAKGLLFRDMSPLTREAIDKGLAEKSTPAGIAGLVIGSPDFQRR